ncbi:RNA polymerase [Cladochytrium replicatum]|nr:RNA polymerase [Cladochytrium replicatum]
MDNKIYEDIMEVENLDADGGKKFDRVSRITATSDSIEMEMTLDFNNEIYPMVPGDKLTVVLARSLSVDGSASDPNMVWRDMGKQSLANDFEYVMYGKVFKYDDSDKKKHSVYVSFGGLLMCLAGDQRTLSALQTGQNIYLLIRKGGKV